jgi:hypothetical protein
MDDGGLILVPVPHGHEILRGREHVLLVELDHPNFPGQGAIPNALPQ